MGSSDYYGKNIRHGLSSDLSMQYIFAINTVVEMGSAPPLHYGQ